MDVFFLFTAQLKLDPMYICFLSQVVIFQASWKVLRNLFLFFLFFSPRCSSCASTALCKCREQTVHQHMLRAVCFLSLDSIRPFSYFFIFFRRYALQWTNVVWCKIKIFKSAVKWSWALFKSFQSFKKNGQTFCVKNMNLHKRHIWS